VTHPHPTSDSATDPNDADRVRAACQDLIAASADIWASPRSVETSL
jgi:hypothetical protein